MRSLATRHQLYVGVREYQAPEGVEVWWRAEDRRYANYDPWAEYEQPNGSHLELTLTPYAVEKYTPKGVWLRGAVGFRTFVLGTATKQFAVPTRELAVRDLVARKQRHVSGCKARLVRAEEHLEAAEKWLEMERKDSA